MQDVGVLLQLSRAIYSHGSITRLIFRQQAPASSKPFSEPKFHSRCHFFKEKRKLSAVFVTILTIDALPTRPVTNHKDNFAVFGKVRPRGVR